MVLSGKTLALQYMTYDYNCSYYDILKEIVYAYINNQTIPKDSEILLIFQKG